MSSMSEGTPRPRRMLRPWVYIALPLIALATDLAFFPLLESRVAAPPLSVESLVLHGRQAVGRIRLHEIKATLDTLDAPAFAADVRDGPSAIIVPCFLMTDSRGEKDVEIGQLGRYVQRRLTAISP